MSLTLRQKSNILIIVVMALIIAFAFGLFGAGWYYGKAKGMQEGWDLAGGCKQ